MNMHTQTDTHTHIHTLMSQMVPLCKSGTLGVFSWGQYHLPILWPYSLLFSQYPVFPVPLFPLDIYSLSSLWLIANGRVTGKILAILPDLLSLLPSLLSTTLRLAILKHSTITPLYSKSSSYGLWADGPWVMMAKAFRPCGKTRPSFESVLLLMPLVKGVQTQYMHTSAPANENIRLLTDNLKKITWSKVIKAPSSAPARTDLQRAVVNTACPSTLPVQLNLLI